MSKNLVKALSGACCLAAGAAGSGESDHECTSWLIFSDLTGNATHLLHKNRDASPRNLLPLLSRPDSPRKWIGLGDGKPGGTAAGTVHVCMGINSSGLAAAVNSGEITVEPSAPRGPVGTPAILRSCLEECDTASQAVEKVREFLRARRYAHGKRGSLFLFMDTKEACIAEVTAERCSAARYDHGYALRANIWHNPDMASVAVNTIDSWLNSCNREYMVIRNLNRVRQTQGKITAADCLAISRLCTTPHGSPITRTLCSQSTNSASTLEIDLQHPEVLSTGYFLIGPPRHTICVPVPICVEELPPAMTELRWSAAAWKRFDERGFDAKIPPKWREFEAASLERYQAVRAEAKKLLDAGRRDEAVKLLNDTAASIWEAARKLLKVK